MKIINVLIGQLDMKDETPVTLNEGSMSALSGMRPDISGSGPGVSGMMPDCEVRTTSGVTEAASPHCNETGVSSRSRPLVLHKVASDLHPKVRNHGEGPY